MAVLRFFRHLRLGLFQGQRTGRYLGYALGEIVLVVIGILIALQVNSYYESIKQRRLAVNYVDLIVKDLRQDLANIDSLVRYADMNIRNAQAYFDYFEAQKGAGLEALIDSVKKVQVAKLRYIPVEFTFRDIQF